MPEPYRHRLDVSDPAVARAEQALRAVREARADLGGRIDAVKEQAERTHSLVQAHIGGTEERARNYSREMRRWIAVVAAIVGTIATAVPQCSSAAPVARAILETLSEE